MTAHFRNLPSVLTLLVTVIVAACAPQRTPLTSDDGYPLPAAKEVFTAGYENIRERYIEGTSPGNFAMAGLRGLGSIDPAITIELAGGDVIVKVSGTITDSFPAPANDDAEAWADLTVQVTALGRQQSAEMRNASAEQIYESVFDGILSNLDIYSRYAGSREAKKNRAKRSGFGGIGVRFRIVNNFPQVTFVMPETPAYDAGLKMGDRITDVDDETLRGLKQDQVSEKLRGPLHSQVTLKIDRKGQSAPLVVKVERAHIVADTVTYGHKGGIVFLKISTFNQSTARNLLNKLKKARTDLGDDIKGIVLDMRGNPGGLLKQSIQVADLFLAQGRISETRGRHPDSFQSYDAGGRDMAYGRPVVVLIDGKSASAAEVAAAALQDRGRAVVIGTSSFGKGTVQTVIRLPNEGEITLTWSRLIAPSGFVLHGLGVFPTICTSGTDGNGVDGEALVKLAIRERIKTAAVMEAWRRASFQEKAQRQELRAFCPPERRNLQLDSKVAEALLNSKALYARTLNLSASAAAAR
ncbi:MAG: PDZ domain-containing protein [Rhodospirillales bacterium]|nr:PDZ domain-containing protein [Rhodospirillales bacterium]